MKKPLISVIVPLYNQERYIKKCIQSITKQTFHDIEIILINDASTDCSMQKIEEIIKKDSRIKLLQHEQNRGVEQSRYDGIQAATGDFLLFVDSDDCLPVHAIEILQKKQEKTDADIVEGAFSRFIGGSLSTFVHWSFSKRSEDIKSVTLSQPELFNDYYISFFGVNKLKVSLCGKLFKRKLFDAANITPPIGLRMGEDQYVSMQLFPHVQRYTLINNVVYHYRWGGITSHYNPTFYRDLKELYRIKTNLIAKHNYTKATKYTKIEMCNILFSQCVQMFRFKKNEKEIEDFLQEEKETGFIDEISKGLKCDIPHIALLQQGDTSEYLKMAHAKANKGKWLRKILSLASA